MSSISIHEKAQIEAYLLRDPLLHLYALGDLDPFFWPSTTWYAWQEKNEMQALVLLYRGSTYPTLLALTRETKPMLQLLNDLLPMLPPQFYAHLSPGLKCIFETHYHLDSHGMHYRMGLTKSLQIAPDPAVVFLGPDDLNAIYTLYSTAYPNNWFDPRMLQTGQYTGIYANEQLVSIAGIHVYSKHYKAAALGNITTHPAYRGQKLAQKTTVALCTALQKEVQHIGLNVHSHNVPALHCYKKIGFEISAEFEEFTLVLKPETLGSKIGLSKAKLESTL